MIDIGQDDYRVDSAYDLYTYGLGPCVGIIVGYKGRVSMLHAPMPDAGATEEFFAELCDSIPQHDRASIHPIFAGALANRGYIAPHLSITRSWVKAKMRNLGFGLAQVHWGSGGILACHNATTCIEKGTVEISHHELVEEPKIIANCPLW